MKNYITIGLMLVILLNTGCITSYLSLKSSQRDIAIKHIIISQDKDAIEAMRLGVQPEVAIKAIKLTDGAGIGIDLLALDTITENPLRQTGAAILDALLMWGSYEVVKYIKDQTGAITTTNNITINCNCTVK